MKKRKLIYLFPLAALLLSGCSFAEFKKSVGDSWIGQHILHPIYDPIKNLINGGGKEEQKSSDEDDQKGDDHHDDPAEVETGTLESPISLSKFQSEVDKLIDYATVESGKTVTDPDNLFFVKGKVTSNYAPNNDGEIQYLNLVDLEDESVAVTGYYVLVDSSVTESITKDSLAGAEVVVKGYGALFNHSQKGKTYEIMKKDNDNRAYLMSVKAGEQTKEPEKIEKTLAQIVAGEKSKSQAYISRAKIKSWATNAGAASETKTKYGNLILTDGQNDVFVYGASGVATDLAWNGSEYKMSNSKQFLTNVITKDLVPNDEVYFWGIYYDFVKDGKTTTEMDIIITGKVPVAAQSISIDVESTEMYVGGELALGAILSPQGAGGSIVWSLGEGEGALAHIENGVLYGDHAGTVHVTATVEGTAISDTVAIVIKAPTKVLVTSITPNPEEIALEVGGEAVQFSYTVEPSNVEEEIEVSIKSGEDVISLGENNTVSPIKKGNAVIRIQGKDSKVGVDVPVTVTIAEGDTYGTLENPISVTEAREIAAALENAGSTTTYAEKPAYVTGVALADAQASTKVEGTYQFNVGESLESTDKLSFYWGYLDDGVSVPQKGQTVVLYGTIAHYKNSSGYSTYELAGKADQGIDDPRVLCVVSPELTGLTFKRESYDVNVGSEKDLSGEVVLAPVGAVGTATFTVSGNADVSITSAGLLSVGENASGTATVTATIGNFNATCTINVTSGAQVEVPVTILPSDGTACDSADFTITKDPIQVAVTASTLNAEQIRVYKGKTITISSDKTIVSIVMTCTANGAAKYGPGAFGNGAPAGYTFEADGNTGTWTGSENSIAFTATDNQVRITSLVVTYLQ